MHSDINWVQVTQEGIQLLQELVRFDTSNPPGNELPAVEFLKALFAKDGVPTEILSPQNGRANLIARLPGQGKQAPLLLLAHLDVVGVEKEKWSVDPFSGMIQNGYLYGRGAIDDKGMVVAETLVILTLKRLNIPLKREVIFLAAADEESGGKLGIAWLVENHFEKIRAEFAINEGGRIRTEKGKVKYVCIQNSEKVPYNLTLKVKGTPGHASVPLPDNCIFILAQALARIAEHKTTLKLTPTTRYFFTGISKKEKFPLSYYLENVDHPLVGQLCREALTKNPIFYSMLCNSIAPTLLQAGIRNNVIPSETTVNLNCRLLPGEKPEAFVTELQKVINDPRVEITWAVGKQPDAPDSPLDSAAFQALASNAQKMWADSTIVPLLSTGATDSAELRAMGVKSYGILPFPLSEADENRIHGHDERMPLQSFSEGIKYLFQTTLELSSS